MEAYPTMQLEFKDNCLNFTFEILEKTLIRNRLHVKRSYAIQLNSRHHLIFIDFVCLPIFYVCKLAKLKESKTVERTS